MRVLVVLSLVASATVAAQWRPPTGPDAPSDQPIDRLARAVVRIDSTWHDDDGRVLASRTGAGILLTIERLQLHVLTAAHVVRDETLGAARSIAVTFKHDPRRHPPFSARLTPNFSHELDLAVITVGGSLSELDRESAVRLPLDPAFSYPMGGVVTSIGHGEGRAWAIRTHRITAASIARFEVEQAGLTPDQGRIDSGNSGGPILSADNRLVGVVTGVVQGQARAVRLSAVIGQLERWNIAYRIRFATDIGGPLVQIRDAIWDHRADRLTGARCESERHDLSGISRATVDLFGRGESVLVETKPAFYVERIGTYANTATSDEAWQLAVREISRHVAGFQADQRSPREVVFERFRLGRGTIKIAVVESVQSVFVVVYRSETRAGIGPQLPDLPSYVRHRFGFDRFRCEGR